MCVVQRATFSSILMCEVSQAHDSARCEDSDWSLRPSGGTVEHEACLMSEKKLRAGGWEPNLSGDEKEVSQANHAAYMSARNKGRHYWTKTNHDQAGCLEA